MITSCQKLFLTAIHRSGWKETYCKSPASEGLVFCWSNIYPLGSVKYQEKKTLFNYTKKSEFVSNKNLIFGYINIFQFFQIQNYMCIFLTHGLLQGMNENRYLL